MRQIINKQTQFGEIDISKIQFNMKCRDEIPKLLMGLQYIYCTPDLKDKVFAVLEKMVPSKVDKNKGRPGMNLWRILVLGTIKLNCDWDYDKLHNIVNNHKNLRKMLGHGILDENYEYPYQTLQDNVSLLTEDILQEINEIVVKAGQALIKKKMKK